MSDEKNMSTNNGNGNGNGNGGLRTLLKLVVLGDSNVGKTALLHQYVNHKFIETHQATIGADLLTKTVTLDNTSVTMQIWDTAGQERYDALGSAYYRGSDACVIAYDISNKSSFEHVSQWHQNFINNANDSNPNKVKYLLLGNKNDLNNDLRQVPTSEGQKYAQENGMLFFETSAKRGTNVEEAFMALIQEVSTVDDIIFYSTEVANKIKNVEDTLNSKPSKPISPDCLCTVL